MLTIKNIIMKDSINLTSTDSDYNITVTNINATFHSGSFISVNTFIYNGIDELSNCSGI